MSSDEFERDREVIAAATKNLVVYADGEVYGDVGPDDADRIATFDEIEDAEFIARARTRWPAALYEIERLREALKLIADEADNEDDTAVGSLIACVNTAEDALKGGSHD